MVNVVNSNPIGDNIIFLRHLDANFVQKCQKCQIYVIYESLEKQITYRRRHAHSAIMYSCSPYLALGFIHTRRRRRRQRRF